jgi:hypothetical protein
MSRLIRDTDLIDKIEEWRSALVCTPAQYADCVVDGTLETVEEVIIDKAPTAYDVEAVVGELEAARKPHKEIADGKGWSNRDRVHAIGIVGAYNHAIEIVRGGRNEG